MFLLPNFQFVRSITKTKFSFSGKRLKIKPETSLIEKSKPAMKRCILLIELSGDAKLSKTQDRAM